VANLGEMVVSIVGDTTQLNSAIDTSKQKVGQFAEILKEGGPLGQAILSASNMMTKLLANPAVALTAIIVGAIEVFSDFTKELVSYGAQIKETSERTGLSTKALQEYKFIAEQTGGSLETITAAVKMMTRGLETNKDTFAKLGIQTKDTSGNFLSTTDIFDQTIEKLGDLSNDTERTNLALKLFGRGALDMVPLLKEGSKGIEELKNKANELGLVLNDSTIKNAHDFEKSTDALKASWKAFSMSLVQDALPALKLVTDSYLYVTELINRARVAAQNNEIIKAYRDGKVSVIEYHDAVQSMIDMNKQVVNDDKSSASEKRKANQEIADGYAMLTKVRKEYRIAEEEQIKKDNEIAKDNAATKALQDEEDKLQGLRDARDKAAKEYNDSISLTAQLQSKGLRTADEATKEVTDATKKYAEALAPIVAASGSHAIGTEALRITKDALDQLTQASNKYNDDKKAYDDAILARANAYANTIKQQISDEEKNRKEQTEKYNKEVADRDKIIESSSGAYDRLLKGDFKSFDDIEKAKTAAEKSGCISQEEIEKATINAKIKLYSQYVSNVLNTVSSLVSSLKSLYSADVQNKKDAIAQELQYAEDAIDAELLAKEKAAGVATETALEQAEEELRIAQETLDGKLQLIDAEKSALDQEEEAKLYSLGLVEASTLEEYDAEIAAAIAAGDTITANKLQNERDKLAIQQEYDKKRKAIDDAEALRLAVAAATKAQLEQDAADKKKALEQKAAMDTYDVEKSAFETNQVLSIAQATIAGAELAINAYKALAGIPYVGPVLGAAAAAASLVYTGLQIATIKKQVPPTKPSFAEGGIAMPQSGGINATIAEAGQPEVIFPLDKLEQFINQGNTFNGSSDIPISMTIQLDSQTLYSGIFAATRNKTVLISAKAVI
jgi:hypothetical protein